MIIDAHTHLLKADSLVNRYPTDDLPEGFSYSVGIHPWHINEIDSHTRQLLESKARLPEVKAIGETGIDLTKESDLIRQTKVFEHHISLSEEVEKPLIIHCVRAYHLILKYHKLTNPRQPWIIHGFRGKANLATQLTERGIYISVGLIFNVDAVRIIPREHLLIETDDYPSVTIEEVARRVGEARKAPPSSFLHPNAIWLNKQK